MRLAKILIGIFIIGIISLVGLVTLVDPNQFKNTLESQIALNTGLRLNIQGPLHWRINRGLALEINNITVNNAEHFANPLLTLQKARFEAIVWSIFSGKLLFNTELDGLVVRLSRNIAGHTNWQNLTLKATSLLIPNYFKIEGATVFLDDEQHNQHFVLKNTSLISKTLSSGILGISTPIVLTFDFEDLIQARFGNVDLRAEWHLAHSSTQIPTVMVQNVKLKLDQNNLPTTALTGELEIHPPLDAPLVQGKLQIPALPLNAWLTTFDINSSPLQSNIAKLNATFKYQASELEINSFLLALENKGRIEGTLSATLRGRTLSTVQLKGLVQGKELQFGQVPIKMIHTAFSIKNAVINFDPFKVLFANSQHQGTLEIDLNGPMPKYALTNQTESFEVNNLLSTFNVGGRLNGQLHAQATLTAEGHNSLAILQSLSGSAHIKLADGKLLGIALAPLLQHAQSTLATLADDLSKKKSVNITTLLTAELDEWKQQAMSGKELTTPFRIAEMDAIFKNGVLSTADLAVTYPEYTIRGMGTIDLVQHKMDYKTLALLTPKEDHYHPETVAAYLKNSPLAIQIKGSFASLAVNPDLANYTQDALKLVPKESIEKHTDKALEKLFGFQ